MSTTEEEVTSYEVTFLSSPCPEQEPIKTAVGTGMEEKSRETPVEKPQGRSPEKLVQKPIIEPMENPPEKPPEKQHGKSPEESPKKSPIIEPIEKPQEKPQEKVVYKPIIEPIERPQEKPTERPQEKPRQQKTDSKTSVLKLLMEASTSMVFDQDVSSMMDRIKSPIFPEDLIPTPVTQTPVAQTPAPPTPAPSVLPTLPSLKPEPPVIAPIPTIPHNPAPSNAALLRTFPFPGLTLDYNIPDKSLSSDTVPVSSDDRKPPDEFGDNSEMRKITGSTNNYRGEKGPPGPPGPPGVCVCSLKYGHDSRVSKTIIVDPTYGSDTHGKRESRSFRTITEALKMAAMGDVIFLMPGEYETLYLKPNVSFVSHGAVYVRSIADGNFGTHLGVIISGVTFVPKDGTLSIQDHQSLRFERCSFITRDLSRRGSLVGLSITSSTLEFVQCNFILMGGPNIRSIHLSCDNDDHLTILDSQFFIESTSSSNIGILEIAEKTVNKPEEKSANESHLTEFSQPLYDDKKVRFRAKASVVYDATRRSMVTFLRNHLRISQGLGTKIACCVHNSCRCFTNFSLNTIVLETRNIIDSFHLALSFGGNGDHLVLHNNSLIFPFIECVVSQGTVEMESSCIDLSNNSAVGGSIANGVKGRGKISSDRLTTAPKVMVPIRVITANCALSSSDRLVLIDSQKSLTVTLPKLVDDNGGKMSHLIEIKSLHANIGHRIVASPGDNLHSTLIYGLNSTECIKLCSVGRMWYDL